MDNIRTSSRGVSTGGPVWGTGLPYSCGPSFSCRVHSVWGSGSGHGPLFSCWASICCGGGYVPRLMARQWVYDMCRSEWHGVSSQLGLLTATGLTFVVGAMPRLIGGVILLLWSGTCSLQVAGNSGQGENLYGFCLKTLLWHFASLILVAKSEQ